MQSGTSYQRIPNGSPLRGYHSSTSRMEDRDNVFLTCSRQMLESRPRRISSTANDMTARLRSFGSDGKRSPTSLESGSPPGVTHMDYSMEYLANLVKERKQLELMCPHAFQNVERLLDDEISRVRMALFQTDFSTDDVDLPEPKGEVMTITEKIYVPVRDYPDYNFVGRILGPRGMTAKQLEQETGCKIMVRGRGSMKDKRKEEANRGRPNWEHLDDELHVLVQCEDTDNRARVKLQAAMDHVKKLLVPAPEGTDELKRKQLMELAIINGTYRPFHKTQTGARLLTPLPLMSPMNGPLLVSPTSSPTSAPPFMQTYQTSPTNGGSYVKSGVSFDYPSLSAFLNPAFLESALASYQLAHDLNIPSVTQSYPTATSLVNSFPSLFNMSSNSQGQHDSTGSSSSISPN